MVSKSLFKYWGSYLIREKEAFSFCCCTSCWYLVDEYYHDTSYLAITFTSLFHRINFYFSSFFLLFNYSFWIWVSWYFSPVIADFVSLTICIFLTICTVVWRRFRANKWWRSWQKTRIKYRWFRRIKFFIIMRLKLSHFFIVMIIT